MSNITIVFGAKAGLEFQTQLTDTNVVYNE